MEAIIVKHEDVYEQGFLTYALESLSDEGSFNRYAEWLKTEPVMTFINEDGWYLRNDHIVYIDPESNKEEIYEVSLIIFLDEEVILHSLQAGNSWFFNTHQESDKLTALYVD